VWPRSFDPRQQIIFVGVQLSRSLRSVLIGGNHAQISQIAAHGVAGYTQLLSDGTNTLALTMQYMNYLRCSPRFSPHLLVGQYYSGGDTMVKTAGAETDNRSCR